MKSHLQVRYTLCRSYVPASAQTVPHIPSCHCTVCSSQCSDSSPHSQLPLHGVLQPVFRQFPTFLVANARCSAASTQTVLHIPSCHCTVCSSQYSDSSPHYQLPLHGVLQPVLRQFATFPVATARCAPAST